MNLKRRSILSAALVLLLALSLSACGGRGQSGGSPDGNGLTPLTVCLDWTPNTNHTGLYVAAAKGYFAEAGLDVSIVQPAEDGAVSLCAAGQVEMAVSYQDSLAPALARKDPLAVTAVAALVQHNTSGVISRKGEGMDRPAGLEGHTYSTWNGPVELAMMRQVVEADGGDFDRVELIPNNITDEAGALRERQTDAIWIYYGWGGVSAKLSGLDFDYFYFKDIDPVFDYYTPILVANNSFLEQRPDTARALLAAIQKGYQYAIEHPEEAARILIDGDETGSLRGSGELVTESQTWMSGQYQADAPKWGYIDPARWDAFYQWLNENQLVETAIPDGAGFTNGYLPQ